MSERCNILVTGTGFFAERLLFDLAVIAPQPVRVVIAGRNRARAEWLATTANARAAVFARPAAFEAAVLAWDTPAAIAETVGPLGPEAVIQTASLQSPWDLVDHPESPWSKFVNRLGGLGALAFLQALLTARVARAMTLAGIPGALANACYPDLTNRILALLGLEVACGLGNVAILAAAFAADLGVRNPGVVRVLAHHRNLAMFFRPVAERQGPPPRVWVEGEEIPDAQARFAHLHLPRKATVNALAGGTAAPVALALAGLTDYQGHVPGPLGLVGGYPVALRDGRLALDLPPGLTAEAAALWFHGFEAWEPLRVADDGQLSFNERAAAALRPHLPALADGFPVDDLEPACAAVLALRQRLTA